MTLHPPPYAVPARRLTRAERDLRRLPQEPAEYHQLLRGPGRRWWKPLLSLLLVAVIGVVLAAIGYGLGTALDLVTGRVGFDTYFTREVDSFTPAGFLGLNLALAAFLPAVGLATWIVHRVRPGFVASVAGRMRWAWLIRCLLVVVPLWAVFIVVSLLVNTEPLSAPPPERLTLIVIVLLTTPLQCAAEEYVFRGWVLQNVGAWFSHRIVGVVAGTVVASALFALAHGSLDLWILADLAVFSTAACVLAWRTGGLEAGIVVHTVNNVGLMVTTLIIGGWVESFVDAGTTGDPLQFLLGAAAQAGAVALVLWQARRVGLETRYRPARPSVEPSFPSEPLPPQIADPFTSPAYWSPIPGPTEASR